MSIDTGKARLPGLPAVATGNAALDKWIRAVSERLEVREGARGNPYERVILERDLIAMGLTGRSTMTPQELSESIRKTRLYHELKTAIGELGEQGSVPSAMQALLSQRLADEARARGADIRRLEASLQNAVALVAAGDTNTDPLNPTPDRIPFGVDAKGVYINGQLRINASGQTIESVIRSITLSSTSTVFNVDQYNVAAPSSVTLTATLVNGLTGTPTFTVVSGTATLTGSGLTRNLAYADMGSDRVVVRASVTMAGSTYNADILIYKARDGQVGATGSTGAAGQRGSATRYGPLTGVSDWSSADAVVANALVGEPRVIGDTVTLSSSTKAVTKYWDGAAWANPGVVIDGNLLVSGSVAASRLAAGAVVAGSLTLTSLAFISGPVTITAGRGVGVFYHYTGRIVAGFPSFTPPAGHDIFSALITYSDNDRTEVSISIFTNAGVGYNGTITGFFGYL
jgi:hypothetical protein